MQNKIKVIVGLQWGDEGKGKFIDFLVSSENKNKKLVVARFQGGSNAGHSIEFGDRHIVFHALPSGMLNENAENLIGAGVNVDAVSLQKEIEEIKDIAPWWRKNLYLSREATVVVPTAKLMDNAQELERGVKKIGTTGRAIGPTYSDFYGRTDDLAVYEALDEDLFRKRYAEIRNSHLKILSGRFDLSIDEKELAEEEKKFFDGVEFLRGLQSVTCQGFVREKLSSGKEFLAEGAQGTLLDVRFGSRRDVTSSYTTSAGACVGLGAAPSDIGSVLGISKAYATRVGAGPFPTELGGKEAEEWAATKKRQDEADLSYDINEENAFRQGIALRNAGQEYGATTGRLRRCGWLDLPLLKYAIELNGVTELGITKLDVLDGLKEIEVCVGYENMPRPDMNRLREVRPVYKKLPGWQESTRGCTSYEKLPKEAQEYIKFIEKETGVPVTLISTGPGRNEMIIRK